MYPTITDLLNDLFGNFLMSLFGHQIPPLPIQTFGFMMALSFAGAYYTTNAELIRKEKLGLILPVKKKVIKNKRVSQSDFVIQTIIGSLIGYKVIYLVLNFSEFSASPQSMILSAQGNVIGALLGGAWSWYQKWKEDKEAAKYQPTEVNISVQPHELMWNIVFISAISGLIGAKIFHNLENISDLINDPVDALLSFSGLTFYGGLIVATIAVLYYTHRNNIPTMHMIDAAAPGLMLAYGIGRIGCQLSGDGDWGIVNTAPKPGFLSFLPDWTWSFQYPHNVVNEGVPIPGCVGSHCNMLPEPVFPTPFYEVIMGLALFVFLWSIRKRIKIPGLLFCIYMIVNGVERFFIEKIRVNSTYAIFGKHITQAELISSGMVIFGIAGIFWLHNRNKRQHQVPAG